MDIIFSTTKLQKDCNDDKRLIQRYGSRGAKLIRRRLDEIFAADVLQDLRALPQARCHELLHDRAGQLSVDLEHPYRLIFIPANIPVPRKADGGLDWCSITAVEILGVDNTHE
jgi:proteic killer suppression protein